MLAADQPGLCVCAFNRSFFCLVSKQQRLQLASLTSLLLNATHSFTNSQHAVPTRDKVFGDWSVMPAMLLLAICFGCFAGHLHSMPLQDSAMNACVTSVVRKRAGSWLWLSVCHPGWAVEWHCTEVVMCVAARSPLDTSASASSRQWGAWACTCRSSSRPIGQVGASWAYVMAAKMCIRHIRIRQCNRALVHVIGTCVVRECVKL